MKDWLVGVLGIMKVLIILYLIDAECDIEGITLLVSEYFSCSGAFSLMAMLTQTSSLEWLNHY